MFGICLHQDSKTQSCVDKKSLFSHFDSSSKQWILLLIGHSWGQLDIISHVYASGYIFRFTFRSLSDVSYSDECQTKKSFQYVKRMLPLLRAIIIIKFYNHLLPTPCNLLFSTIYNHAHYCKFSSQGVKSPAYDQSRVFTLLRMRSHKNRSNSKSK